MARDKDKDAGGGAAAQLERIAHGLQPESGWCIDFDRPKDDQVFRCDEELEQVAVGDLSRSYDGTTLSRTDTGEVIKGVNMSGLAASVPATPRGAVPVASATSTAGGGGDTGGGTTGATGGGRTTNP
jgi:hypothetical protein